MRERISDREGAHLTALCTVFVYRLRDTRDTNDSDQTIAASISLLSAGGLSLSLSLSLSLNIRLHRRQKWRKREERLDGCILDDRQARLRFCNRQSKRAKKQL